MNSIDKRRFFWVVISALIQGLLLGVYAVVRSGPLLCMPLSIIFLIPFVFWLSQEHWGRRLANFLTGLTLVLLAFWVYRLWSLYSPNASFYVVPSQKSDLIRTSIAVFLLIPFFQCRIAAWSWKFPYSEIFFQFCRNLFLLFQASIVIAVFWGLLVTAGLLFDIVGLDNVPYIIFNPITAVPLSSLTISVSISVAIKHPGIDSLGRWILSVLAWLLPFFSVLSVVFIMCLPFSGLRTLWSTGQASTLMLLLQFGTIILANAAWLDGTKPAFTNKHINNLAQVSLLCLPVYTVLCMYSVGLRIEQYGLTVDRVQAMFLAVVTGIWGLGYAGAVVFRKWPSSIGRVNMSAVIILMVIVGAMNSPVLDPYRLAAYNQAERLSSGKISPEDFDYIYTRFNLGRYGSKILTTLSTNPSSRVRRGVAAAMSVDPAEYLAYLEKGIPPVSRRREIISGAKVYPSGSKLSDEHVSYFINYWNEDDTGLISGVQGPGDIAFVYLDVERDAHNVMLITSGGGVIFTIEDSLRPSGVISGTFTPGNLEVRTLEPRFKDVAIGGSVYQIQY